MAGTTAQAQQARPFLIAPTIGVRDFDSNLDLNSEISAGLRIGLGASPRFGVLLDFVYTSPSRSTTGTPANVTAVRGLAQYKILSGAVRPYLLGGVGGVLFDFRDSFDTASITATLGGGVEYRLGLNVGVFAEASVDGYRARTVTYSSTGEEIQSTERETDATLSGCAGIAVEF